MGKSTPEVKTHGLNETQEKLQHKGYPIKNSTTKRGFTPKPPLHILVKRAIDQPKTIAIKTPPEKKRPYQQKWRVVQTPQAAKKEADSSLHITIDEGELSPEDGIDAPPGLEEQVKAIVDELKEVNLGTAGTHALPTSALS
ncbi:hypothetical protein LIER_01869 [Lithospermum erythrorhizon]|uniref:Uncharacterized protein n=1 Tax=Lithospermum erythrorhizon TaxID=34254 RepID=A0AAV3NNP9_LITER